MMFCWWGMFLGWSEVMDVIRKDEICSFNCSLNKHKSSLRYDFALCSK